MLINKILCMFLRYSQLYPYHLTWKVIELCLKIGHASKNMFKMVWEVNKENVVEPLRNSLVILEHSKFLIIFEKLSVLAQIFRFS